MVRLLWTGRKQKNSWATLSGGGNKAFFTAGKALTHWPLRLRRDIILTATAVFDNGRLVAYSVATKPHITTDSSDKSMAGT